MTKPKLRRVLGSSLRVLGRLGCVLAILHWFCRIWVGVRPRGGGGTPETKVFKERALAKEFAKGKYKG